MNHFKISSMNMPLNPLACVQLISLFLFESSHLLFRIHSKYIQRRLNCSIFSKIPTDQYVYQVAPFFQNFLPLIMCAAIYHNFYINLAILSFIMLLKYTLKRIIITCFPKNLLYIKHIIFFYVKYVNFWGIFQDQNMHQNAPNCTKFSKFSLGIICPRAP